MPKQKMLQTTSIKWRQFFISLFFRERYILNIPPENSVIGTLETEDIYESRFYIRPDPTTLYLQLTPPPMKTYPLEGTP